jgi:hypothetical protein
MLSKIKLLAFLTILALTFTGLSACGDEGTGDTPADTATQDVGAVDSGPNGDVAATDTTHPSGLSCLPVGTTILGVDEILTECVLSEDVAGLTFLIDSMVVTAPANDALLTQLNTLWAADLAADKLIILFHVKSWDTSTGLAQVQVGAGKLDGGNYAYEGVPTEIDLWVDGCNHGSNGPENLSLAPASLNKPVHMTGITVCGQVSPDGATIPFSYLSGSIRKSDAEGVEVSINPDAPEFTVDLAALLESFVDMDTDTTGDGSPDAWALQGSLTGKAITNVSIN